ncbi:MAG: biopolymer transporter ExbD [Bacteroidales bacterium]|jgi:biopolymer transport protein ExbD|nr:biopolymer transporter ExbD [Bacteroidales bacterium]
MAIRPKHTNKIEFNLTTQGDLVFLLLIFFMITSTMVSPNAIKLLLPNSSSKTIAKRNFEVYIDKNLDYSILNGKDLMAVEEANLSDAISQCLVQQADTAAAVVVRADESVPVQNVVNVIDAVNQINENQHTAHKVILATKPKK